VRFSKFDFGNKPAVIPGVPAKAAGSAAGKKTKSDKHVLLKKVRQTVESERDPTHG